MKIGIESQLNENIDANISNPEEPNTENGSINQIEEKVEENVDENNQNPFVEDNSNENNKTYLNQDIINFVGYNSESMVDDILNSIDESAKKGNIVNYVDGKASEEIVSSEQIKANTENYKNIIISKLNNKDIVNSIKYEKGVLTCEYNIKNILNELQLECKSYSDFGVNENNLKEFKF